ncbi:MAG: peptidylprolyl isomerase [Alphaproteobacteria bacterium]
MTPAGLAQDVQRIAALVNDQVISAYDLEQRVRLVVSTSGLNPTPEALERVREQVLRTLVDEELQLQEAAQAEVNISEQEIDQAIERLAARNSLSRAQIVEILSRAGVNEYTLRRQIAASIAWDTLTQGRFASRISVTPDEVDQALEQLAANSDKPQYNILELFMAVDTPEQDESVRRTALRFVDQLRKGEANFSDLARQFSQAPSAGAGGAVGWVTTDELPAEIAKTLQEMRPGTLSPPVRTIGGYYIIVLRERRIGHGARPEQVRMQVKQLVIPAPKGFPPAYVQQAGQAAAVLSGRRIACGAVEKVANDAPELGYADLGERQGTDFTPLFQRALAGLTEGDVTQPVQTDVGFHILYVCTHDIEGSLLPPREAVEDRLFQQQLSMVQRRFLRDLRRDATVEMR